MLDISTEGQSITLTLPGCIFCGELEQLRQLMGKKVCKICAQALPHI